MKKTSLYGAHEKSGAKLVEFAGWSMPIQYEGIVKEHLWCRQSCSIFDTSHMVKFTVKGQDAAGELGRLITSDPGKAKQGRCRYCFILNEKGGIIDDAVVYTCGYEDYMLVANAGTKEKDFSRIAAGIKNAVLEDADAHLDKIDVQGPLSDDVLRAVFGIDVSGLSFYSFATYKVLGGDCIVSFSGYTGGKGYEIYITKEKTMEAWDALLSDRRVKPAGLGARDTLRLEAGLPLYGQDLDEDTTPIEAGMEKFLDFAHEFTGRDALREREPLKNMVFLLSLTRQAPRHGYEIFAGGESAGFVTSGSFSPCLQKGMGIAYVRAGVSIPEDKIVSVGTKGGTMVECFVVTKKQLKERLQWK